MANPPVALDTTQKTALAAQPNTGATDWLTAVASWAQATSQHPEVMGAMDASVVTAMVGVMTAVGLCIPWATPFDTAAGVLIGDMVAPVVEATVTNPMRAALAKYFRYSAPNVTRIVDLLTAGVIDSKLAREGLELNSIAEPFIGPIIHSGLQAADKTALAETQLQDSENFKAQLAATTTALDLLKTDVSRFSSEAKAARTKYLTYTRRLKRSQGTDALNQGYIEDSLADAATILDDINGVLSELNKLTIPEGSVLNIKPQPGIATNYTPVDVANLAYWTRDLHIAIGRAWSEGALALVQQQKADLAALKQKKYDIPPPAVKPPTSPTPDPFSGLTYNPGAPTSIAITAPLTAATGTSFNVGVSANLQYSGNVRITLSDGKNTLLNQMQFIYVAEPYNGTVSVTMPGTDLILTAQIVDLTTLQVLATNSVTVTNSSIAVTPTCPAGSHWDATTKACVLDTVTPPPVTQYTLTIGTAAGGTTSPGPGKYTGTSWTVTATAATGEIFTNWTLDGMNGGTTNPITIAASGNNHTIIPNFKASAVTGPNPPISFSITCQSKVIAEGDAGLIIHVVGKPGIKYNYTVIANSSLVSSGSITLDSSGIANYTGVKVTILKNTDLEVSLIEPSNGFVYGNAYKTITIGNIS